MANRIYHPARMAEHDIFAARIARHEPGLRKFLHQRMSPRLRLLESLSDLLQSVYCDLWRRRAALPDDSAAFAKYARLAAQNKARDKARHYSSHRRNSDRTTGLERAESVALSAANPAARALEIDEECIRLAQVAAGTLSEPECVAFIRCVLQGESATEVAAETGQRPNTVAVRVHRAMAKLALALEKRAASGATPPRPAIDPMPM